MKKFALILLVFVASCSLNSKQEKVLNLAMSNYLTAYNDGELLTIVAYTHPNAVRHYKDLGDGVFKKHFKLSTDDELTSLSDPTIYSTASEGDKIHVKYKLKNFRFQDYERQLEKEVFVIAITEDAGNTWFFIEDKDYYNNEIINEKDRLLSP